MKNKKLKLAALLLMIGPFAANAVPITWTLTDVVFDDGATATGTFNFDAAENLLSDINIQTSAGAGVFALGNTYFATLGAGAGKIALTTTTNIDDLTNQFILDLLFDGDGLTDAGGIVGIGDTANGSPVESYCLDILCDNQDPQRLIISGSVVADLAVPEPSTLALLGLGLAGMGLARRRRKV